MSSHDLLLLALGSLSGFSLSFFIFACWYSEQVKAFKDTAERQIADAKRISWASGYQEASRNFVSNNLNVMKP
jgi:hypothetical protein